MIVALVLHRSSPLYCMNLIMDKKIDLSLHSLLIVNIYCPGITTSKLLIS